MTSEWLYPKVKGWEAEGIYLYGYSAQSALDLEIPAPPSHPVISCKTLPLDLSSLYRISIEENIREPTSGNHKQDVPNAIMRYPPQKLGIKEDNKVYALNKILYILNHVRCVSIVD